MSFALHRNHNSKVIYYHDVNRKYTDMGTEKEVILKHMKLVRNWGYEIVDSITSKQSQIMICFDDGWAGIYESKDIFIENQVFPTVFIAVDLIGKPGYLTVEQIRELHSLGFHFEGHAWSHRDLTSFDDKGLEHEIIDSKEELSQLLGYEIDSICFPQGRFSNKVVACCQKAGYSRIYSSIAGSYYDMLEKKGIICRNLVQSVSDREFKYILFSTSPVIVNRAIRIHYQK